MAVNFDDKTMYNYRHLNCEQKTLYTSLELCYNWEQVIPEEIILMQHLRAANEFFYFSFTYYFGKAYLSLSGENAAA